MNLVYSDTPFGLEDHQALLSRYADELRSAAAEALEEEAILIAVLPVSHSE